MGYRLPLAHEAYTQYKIRMYQKPAEYIKLLNTSKIANPPNQKESQTKNNQFQKILADLTGKGKNINKYI
ncbi:hypothetical protein [Heyndrickxia vini]|uniref:Uncharacterized protein n=1 Tax=Heyndrickxia vini TaxID=1476025 RepID=A0ABX7E057_9BACI|nr:hypothetical protein [Heyndrickxia vini]QQZ08172.1 hypothetical protein I5776_13935 [Heyndrickxia vini]